MTGRLRTRLASGPSVILGWSFIASALTATGCSGTSASSASSNPLVGRWTTAVTVATATFTETVDVNSNGTLAVTVTDASPSCSGTETTTGYAWAATAASITVSGTRNCSGAITCGTVSFGCSDTNSLKAAACTYTLSNNNDTLALTACTGIADVTFTRGS